MFSFKSKNSVFKLVNKLVDQGFVRKDESGKLIPDSLAESVKILGTVQAGFPTAAEEELADTMSLDDFLINNQEATFMLKVSGDSMIEAGIVPGDLVLVERGLEPRNGDIVIAEVDSEWTMKYFKKENNKIFLIPANKKYKTIMPDTELKVTAIVKAVIRKY